MTLMPRALRGRSRIPWRPRYRRELGLSYPHRGADPISHKFTGNPFLHPNLLSAQSDRPCCYYFPNFSDIPRRDSLIPWSIVVLFTTASSLQACIDNLEHSYDFGVCFLDQDGPRCCCIMSARETKRTYSLPSPRYWSSQDPTSNYEFPDPGCKALF